MLTVEVRREPSDALSVDRRPVRSRMTFVRQGGKLCVLQECESLENATNVCIATKEWGRLRNLPLPQNVQNAIELTLTQYHAKHNLRFDSYAFVNHVCGVELHASIYFRRYWKLRPHLGPLSPGTIVFLTNPGNEFCHAAVYVGRGLFVSVYGPGGYLEVATMKDMMFSFGAKQVRIARPKGKKKTAAS